MKKKNDSQKNQKINEDFLLTYNTSKEEIKSAEENVVDIIEEPIIEEPIV